MKIIKTASGKKTIKMSKKEWQSIGKKAGWMKKAENIGSFDTTVTLIGDRDWSVSEIDDVLIQVYYSKSTGEIDYIEVLGEVSSSHGPVETTYVTQGDIFSKEEYSGGTQWETSDGWRIHNNDIENIKEGIEESLKDDL